MKPSALASTNFPVPRPTALPPVGIQPGSQCYKAGKVTIIVSPPYGSQGWHMSISRPDRYPSWDEIVYYRYHLLPESISMAMILPSAKEYVNLHSNCFHLHQEIPNGR